MFEWGDFEGFEGFEGYGEFESIDQKQFLPEDKWGKFNMFSSKIAKALRIYYSQDNGVEKFRLIYKEDNSDYQI